MKNCILYLDSYFIVSIILVWLQKSQYFYLALFKGKKLLCEDYHYWFFSTHPHKKSPQKNIWKDVVPNNSSLRKFIKRKLMFIFQKKNSPRFKISFLHIHVHSKNQIFESVSKPFLFNFNFGNFFCICHALFQCVFTNSLKTWS